MLNIQNEPSIAILRSGDHCHLSVADCTQLFGERGLTPAQTLGGSGYKAKERVLLLTPSGSIVTSLPVVGPPSHFTQVELSASSAYRYGYAIARRLSMRHEGTPGFWLAADKANRDTVLEKPRGLIVCSPHIHMHAGRPLNTYIPHATLSTSIASINIAILPSYTLKSEVAHLDTDTYFALGIGSLPVFLHSSERT